MEVTIRKAAAIGGGVIGGGWIARLILSGIDVTAYDPHPEAARIVGEVVANAERAWAKLTAVPLPPRGRLSFAGSVAEAVAGADFIQESVPERLDLKRGVLEAIDAAAPADALIGSSTSGLLPSDLQINFRHPERFVVAHPYNPVYLLPLVELVGGKKTSAATIERAKAVYASLGMKGAVITKEIEAFVGDRLLEALWREALWLIKDDICDVETLDDVIRHSFGLRWAQMGLFQTYRIAGGEAGMRHFLAQFGPCLKWPWTKLTDVPDLDDALVDKIAVQSDAQAAGLGIRELERIRDDNLVGILHALKAGHDGRGWGAGAELKAFEERLWRLAKSDASRPGLDLSQPLKLHEATVSAAWTDYNGHMTEFRYLQVLADATDVFLRFIGIDADTAAAGTSYYTVETHIRHIAEARQGARLSVQTQVLAGAGKRLHLFHSITDANTGTVHATGEHMLIHVRQGRASDPDPAVARRLTDVADAQAGLPKPEGAGRAVGQPRG